MKPGILLLSLLCALLATTTGWAQKDQDSFFRQMGLTDGRFEQRMQFVDAQDEMDYWKDQRTFEQSLQGQKPEAYRSYILAKREVYSEHRSHCHPKCPHGNYYWLQASYYAQFGSEVTPRFAQLEQKQSGNKSWQP